MAIPKIHTSCEQPPIAAAMSRLRGLVQNDRLLGEVVIFYSQGDMSTPEEVQCDVSWADESGDNSVRGDGRSTLNQARGKRVRSTCVIEAPSNLVVNGNGRDLFKVTDPTGTDVFVSLHRRDGIDEVSQTLVCVTAKEHFAQPGRRDG